MLAEQGKIVSESEQKTFLVELQDLLCTQPSSTFWENILSRNLLMKEWGFSQWSCGSLAGVTRRVTFVKGALLGEVARYYAEDTIIWRCGCDVERNALWNELKPKSEVQSQRFLFLLNQEESFSQIKSFLLGLRGFAEFHSFHPGSPHSKRILDLQQIILLAARKKLKDQSY